MPDVSTSVVVLLDSADESEAPLEVAAGVQANAPAGMDLRVCSFFPPTPNTFDVDVHSLDGAHRLDPGAYRRLRGVLQEADLVHVHSNAVGAVARVLAAAMGVPVVKSEHNPHTAHGPGKTLVNALANLLSTVVVAVSESVAESVPRWEAALLAAAGVETVVIPNGVDVAAVDRAADDPPPLALPEGFLVGGGGRMVPQKNLSTLLEATARAAAHRPDTHLVLTGDGPRRGRLESLAVERGIRDRVHFTGWLDRRREVHALLHHLDVFAFPSRYEGWGVAAGEAMAAGIPVIAGDVPALREVVGRAGLFVDPDDHAALAARVVALANDPDRRRDLGMASRRRLRNHYPLERTVEEHLRLYRRVTGGRE